VGEIQRVERSVEQAAKNEATFRGANERLEEKVDELDLGETRTPFLCECEEETCTEILMLLRDEYEEVRAHPRRFVLAPGHRNGDDQLIQDGGGFEVIEKQGKEGELVEQQDPRAAG
jgi:hypothetical protein